MCRVVSKLKHDTCSICVHDIFWVLIYCINSFIRLHVYLKDQPCICLELSIELNKDYECYLVDLISQVFKGILVLTGFFFNLVH